MALVSRIYASDYFATLPTIDPDVGAKIDDEINNIVSNVNALDDANIDGSPAIQASKLDLTGSSFLPLAGGSLTGLLRHTFDGIWRKMRADGNALIREFRGSDGSEWGIAYNTEWNGSAWTGRDVTGPCMLIRLGTIGFEVVYSASDASGVVPAWFGVLKVDASGNVLAGATVKKNADYTAGHQPILWSKKRTTQAGTSTYATIKTAKIKRGGSVRIWFTLDSTASGGNIYGQIYLNDVAVGTERIIAATSTAAYEETISGISADDSLQIKGKTAGGAAEVGISDFIIMVDALGGETVTLE